MLSSIVLLIVFIFIIYLIFDLTKSSVNGFSDKWAKKTLFLWLPFYALWRLIKEMFLGKR